MAKEILCGFGIDVDAVAGWLGSYGGENSPDDISRGMFAGEVGSLRLLELFDRWGIKTQLVHSWALIETFPQQMKAVAEARSITKLAFTATRREFDRDDAGAGDCSS